jgi:hypothetical protein
METSNEPLQLDKANVVQQKIMDIPTSLFESLFCLRMLLNTTTVQNFEVMLRQTLIHLVISSLIFCNTMS